jgi:hypothetical protein
MNKDKEIKCVWVDELKGMLFSEWPDFKPNPNRLDSIKSEMQHGECIFPVRVVCSHMTGVCKIEDGRHRIIAAEQLGRKQLLTEIDWTEYAITLKPPKV